MRLVPSNATPTLPASREPTLALLASNMDLTDTAADASTPPPSSTFWAAGALGLLATAVGAILPVLVGVWQKQAALAVDQAGFVAAMELFAQVAGTGFFMWASRRGTLRPLAGAGLGILIVGNVATAVSGTFAALLLA